MTDTPDNADILAPAANPDLRWYVVHAYSGMEKAVERNIAERIARSGMEHKFGRILVPTEEVVEIRNGQRRTTERRFFPGYVLVEMIMDDDTWHLVKHTSKVTGFVGGAKNRPAPISQDEVQKIVSQMREGSDGSCEGRPVHRLQRHGRGSQLRKEQDSRVSDHFRSRHAGRTGVWSGRKNLNPLKESIRRFPTRCLMV